MSTVQNCIKTLEKVSLVTCSKDVLLLLERTLKNVEPILAVDTRGVEPFIWQSKLSVNQLHEDRPDIKLTPLDLEKNATHFSEDYVVIGAITKKR